MSNASLAPSFRKILWLSLCALIIAAAFAYGVDRDPLSSAETRFVEHSISGLQIVPASCPSDPHFAGECSGSAPPPPNESGSCAIYADPWNISAGGSSILSWNVSDLLLVAPSNITLSGVGAVQRSGTHNTGPLQQSTTYTLSGVYAVLGFPIGSFQCSTTVQIAAQCIPTYSCTAPVNGVSTGIQNSCTSEVTPCNPGLVCQNAQCVCPNGAPPGPSGCEFQFCPVGQHIQNNVCVCDATNQPPDAGGQCTQCTDTYYCSGKDRRANNSCTGDRLVETCAYACAGGLCILPSPQGNITATPSLVREAETSQISWTTQYTTSCTVTENNPDINDAWSGVTGTRESDELEQQTIYTLRCTGIDGSIFTDTATVNIIPVFEEE